tara:strand:+ start:1642 stop:2100 length:459 start_codon:yes stop_codon:yes gene_type:complete
MAVPATGSISLRGLAREKVYDNYSSTSNPTSISLGNLATGTGYDPTNINSPSKPNTTAPHSMLEWRSYDHDAVTNNTSFSASVRYTTDTSACNSSDLSETLWHNGGGTYPIGGDSVWANEAHTTFLLDGYYRMANAGVIFLDSNVATGILCP